MTRSRSRTFNVSVPEELYDRIEKERGLVKRSTFVSELLSKILGVKRQG